MPRHIYTPGAMRQIARRRGGFLSKGRNGHWVLTNENGNVVWNGDDIENDVLQDLMATAVCYSCPTISAALGHHSRR